MLLVLVADNLPLMFRSELEGQQNTFLFYKLTGVRQYVVSSIKYCPSSATGTRLALEYDRSKGIMSMEGECGGCVNRGVRPSHLSVHLTVLFGSLTCSSWRRWSSSNITNIYARCVFDLLRDREFEP